jgi:tetratricopeptide (TPR) repeat protein
MMVRSLVMVTAIATLSLAAQVPTATQPATPHHDANFDSERQRADALFLAQKPLEALPLYEDLCRQDATIAVFAERHAAGLFAKEATLSDPQERLKTHLQGMSEIKRAQALGDNSAYVRGVMDADSKTLAGAILSGVPLTVGYTYNGKPEAQAVFRNAEAAFGRSDWASAATLYTQAGQLDPTWYAPALYAGDSYFRVKDIANAGVFFSKAIAIDPDRETAYRYWGDALFQAGDVAGAKEKFVQAVVAEPYGKPATAELGQWAQRTGHRLVKPAIIRPEFTTPNGSLQISPELEASTSDGRSSWIVYQQYRVAHGARTLNQAIVAGGSDVNAVVQPSGYQHTIAEEHAALRAMLADVNAKLKAGTLQAASLDPSIGNIRALEAADMLGAWVAIVAADAGIRSDYAAYRSNHRKHLVDFVSGYLVQ